MLAGRQPVKRAGGRRVISKKKPQSQTQLAEQSIKRIINKHEVFPIRYKIQEINIRIAGQHLSESETDQNWKLVEITEGHYSRTANCLVIKVGSIETSAIEHQEETPPELKEPESPNTSEPESCSDQEEPESPNNTSESATSSEPGPSSNSQSSPKSDSNSKAPETSLTECTCCNSPRVTNHKQKRLIKDLRKVNLTKTTYPVISVEIYTDDRERWMITAGEMTVMANYVVICGELMIAPNTSIPLSPETSGNYMKNNSDDSEEDTEDSEDTDAPQLVSTLPTTVTQENIELVMDQTGCTRAQVIKELELNNNDIVDAIMNLTEID